MPSASSVGVKFHAPPIPAVVVPSRVTPLWIETVLPASAGGHQILFFLPQNVALGDKVPLTVAIDGRVSAPVLLTVRAN